MEPLSLNELYTPPDLQRERLKLMLLIANRAHSQELKKQRALLAITNTMKHLYAKRWFEATNWPGGPTSSNIREQLETANNQRDRALTLAQDYARIAQRAQAQTDATIVETQRAVELTRRAHNANAELRATIKHLRLQAQPGSTQPSPSPTVSAELAKLRADNKALTHKLLETIAMLAQGQSMAMPNEMAAAMLAELTDVAKREIHGWACVTHAQSLAIPNFDPKDYGIISGREDKHE